MNREELKIYMHAWYLAHKERYSVYRARVDKAKTRAYKNTKAYRHREVAKVRESRHAKRYRAKYPEKAAAHRALRDAISRGEVCRSSVCEKCGKVDPRGLDGRTLIQGHHYKGYEYPLCVQWLCTLCHVVADRALKGSR